MNRPSFKRVLVQAAAWMAAFALCGAIALAQEVAPSSTPAPDNITAASSAGRSDGQIEADVVVALDASKALQGDLITAATIQSEVTLSGTVPSEASKELAEWIASHVPGVIKVHNNLRIGNPQDAAQNAPGPQPPAEEEQEDAGPPAPEYGPLPAPNVAPYPDQGQGQATGPRAGRPLYVPGRPPLHSYETPKGPVTVPPGTLFQVRTNDPVNSKSAKEGTPVEFTVIQDVALDGVLAIPRGATVHGVVTESKKAGNLAGHPELALTLTSLDLGGQSYPLTTDQFKVRGPDKGQATAGHVVGGAIIGTILGCAIGRGPGCAIGAGAGAAAGTAASAASPGPGIWIPAEARVDFHLTAPVTVAPVSALEANRLAQGLYRGGPAVYRHPYGRYGAPYPYAYYGYPPVYYRPFYISGGFYYWR